MNYFISAFIITTDDSERISSLIRLDQGPALLKLLEKKVRTGLDEKEMLDVMIEVVKRQCDFAMDAI